MNLSASWLELLSAPSPGQHIAQLYPQREFLRRAVATFVVDGLPRAAGFTRVRAFSEMADILRRTDVAATIRLEQFWNELFRDRDVALLCGYSLDAFDPHIYRGLLQQVSATHSDLIPVDDYARLER